jgi:hypothetical protein
MEKKIIFQVKSHEGLSLVLEKHKSEWQNFQPMVEAKTMLDDLLQQSSNLRMVTGENSKSVTLVKNNLKNEVLKNTRILSCALIVHADVSNQPEIIKQVESQEKRMNNDRREVIVYDTCKFIYKLAEEHLTDLITYKVTQIFLDDTLKLMNDFKNSIASPITLIRNKKVNNLNLHNIHKEINKLLTKRMDKLMEILALDYPDLAANYFELRRRIKTRGKNKKEIPVLNTSTIIANVA